MAQAHTENRSAFAKSPLDATVHIDDQEVKLWIAEVRDLARGFCGALFLALPLLFTLEMWDRARVIPNWDLALILVAAYLGNVGFSVFNGFKEAVARRAAWFDGLTSMGIGVVASAITLALINQISWDLPIEIIVKLILLETVPTSFGASLAINQLGGGRTKNKAEDAFSADFKKVLATILGALMFSFNIAPTVEPQIIGNGLAWGHTLGIVLFSLAVSSLMVYFAGFIERDGEGVLSKNWIETLFAYIVSLVVSALLLWMFGYIDLGTPLQTAVPWIVTMGYATTLAGAAGRLII